MTMRVLAKDFRRLCESGQINDAGKDLIVIGKSVVADITTPDDVGAGADDIVRTFTISTADVDREGDTISISGWEIGNFERGGAVLWSHASFDPPIATPVRTWVEGNALKSTARFTPKDLYPFGHMIGQMVAAGYSRSTSVGFRPLQWAENQERGGWYPTDFLKQELTEWSVVNVPANPEALADAKALGIDIAPMRDFASRCLDLGRSMGGLLEERDAMEQLYRVAGGEPKRIFDMNKDAQKDVPQPAAPQPDPPKEPTKAERLAELRAAAARAKDSTKQLAAACEDRLQELAGEVAVVVADLQEVAGDEDAAEAVRKCFGDSAVSEALEPDGGLVVSREDLPGFLRAVADPQGIELDSEE